MQEKDKLALVGIVIFALLLFAGCWIHAKLELLDRVASFSKRINTIGSGRGISMPSESRIRKEVESFARGLELELKDLQVSVFAVDDENVDQQDKMTQILYAQKVTPVKHVDPSRYDVDDQSMAEINDMVTQSFDIQITVIEVRARVHGEKWLWSVDKEFEKKRPIHHKSIPGSIAD